MFIVCIKNPLFAWKWQMIFLFFGHFDQKTKNEKWNEPNISAMHYADLGWSPNFKMKIYLQYLFASYSSN